MLLPEFVREQWASEEHSLLIKITIIVLPGYIISLVLYGEFRTYNLTPPDRYPDIVHPMGKVRGSLTSLQTSFEVFQHSRNVVTRPGVCWV